MCVLRRIPRTDPTEDIWATSDGASRPKVPLRRDGTTFAALWRRRATAPTLRRRGRRRRPRRPAAARRRPPRPQKLCLLPRRRPGTPAGAPHPRRHSFLPPSTALDLHRPPSSAPGPPTAPATSNRPSTAATAPEAVPSVASPPGGPLWRPATPKAQLPPLVDGARGAMRPLQKPLSQLPLNFMKFNGAAAKVARRKVLMAP